MYRTPRDWRWWFTIGINPQARHDATHYFRPMSLFEALHLVEQAITDAFTPAFKAVGSVFNDFGDALVQAFSGVLK